MSNLQSFISVSASIEESEIFRSEFLLLCELLCLPIKAESGDCRIKLPINLASLWRFSVSLHDNFARDGISFFIGSQFALDFLARIGVVVSESESFSFLASSEKIFSKMIRTFKSSSLFKEVICGCDIENIFYLKRVFSHSQELITDHDRKEFQVSVSRLCFAFFEVFEFCYSTYKGFYDSIYSQIKFESQYFVFLLEDVEDQARVKETFLLFASSYILTTRISDPKKSVAFNWALFYMIDCVFRDNKAGSFESANNFLETMQITSFFITRTNVLRFRFPGHVVDTFLLIENFIELTSDFFGCNGDLEGRQDVLSFGSEIDYFLDNFFVFERVLFPREVVGYDRCLDSWNFEKLFYCISKLSDIFHLDVRFFLDRWGVSDCGIEIVDNAIDFAILLFKASRNVCHIDSYLFKDDFLPKMLWKKIFLSEASLNVIEDLSFEDLLRASFLMLECFYNKAKTEERKIICEFLVSIGIEIYADTFKRIKIPIFELFREILLSFISSGITNNSEELKFICLMFNYDFDDVRDSESLLFSYFDYNLFLFVDECSCGYMKLKCLFFNMGFVESEIGELFLEFEANGLFSYELGYFFPFLVARKIVNLHKSDSEIEGRFNNSVVYWAITHCASYELERFALEIRESCLSARKNDWNGNWWSRLVFFVDQLYEDAVWPSCSSINYTVLFNMFCASTKYTASELWKLNKNFISKSSFFESSFNIFSKQQLFNYLICKTFHLDNKSGLYISSFVPFNLLNVFFTGCSTPLLPSTFSPSQWHQVEICSPYGSLPDFDFSKVDPFDAPLRDIDCVLESLRVLYNIRDQIVFCACLSAFNFSHIEIEIIAAMRLESFQSFVRKIFEFSEDNEKILINVRRILAQVSNELSNSIIYKSEQEPSSGGTPDDNDERQLEEFIDQRLFEDVVGFDQRSRTNLELGI